MKKMLWLTLITLFSQHSLFAWRPYNRFIPGAEVNSIGGAYTADASGELAALHNPGGLAQIDKTFSLNYEVYAAIIVNDLLATPPQPDFDTFPLFSLFLRTNRWRWSLGIYTRYSSTGLDTLDARTILLTAAYPLRDNLSLGFGTGPVLLLEGDGRGWGWDFNAGLLWRLSPVLQAGVSFQSGFSTSWLNTRLGSSLTETFPWSAEAGISWQSGPNSMLFLSLDYIGIDSISFTLNGISEPPLFTSSLWHRLHPHLGLRFLEPRTGAHLSLGFMTESDYYQNGAQTQYLLTAGVRFFGKKAVFNATLVDSFLLSVVFPRNSREEKLSFSVSVELD